MTTRTCTECGRELEDDQTHCASDDCPRLELIEQARAIYASDEIEIDDSAQVIRSGDNGHWVAAWVYINTTTQGA